MSEFFGKSAFAWFDTNYSANTDNINLTTDAQDPNNAAYGSAPFGGFPTVSGQPMKFYYDTLLVRGSTELPETDLYTIDAEGLSSKRVLYGVRVGQGMTGPERSGRVSVGGKRVMNGKFRDGQNAEVPELWGGQRMAVVGNKKSSTPNPGGGQLQFVFSPFFTKDLVTVKGMTLYNVIKPGLTVNLYRGRTLVKQVPVPMGEAGAPVKLTLNEPDIGIISVTARFPIAVDGVVFEVPQSVR